MWGMAARLSNPTIVALATYYPRSRQLLARRTTLRKHRQDARSILRVFLPTASPPA
jgi:hypothetical protein